MARDIGSGQFSSNAYYIARFFRFLQGNTGRAASASPNRALAYPCPAALRHNACNRVALQKASPCFHDTLSPPVWLRSVSSPRKAARRRRAKRARTAGTWSTWQELSRTQACRRQRPQGNGNLRADPDHEGGRHLEPPGLNDARRRQIPAAGGLGRPPSRSQGTCALIRSRRIAGWLSGRQGAIFASRRARGPVFPTASMQPLI